MALKRLWQSLAFKWHMLGLFGLGLVAALSLPHFYILPAFIPGLVALLWLVETNRSLKRGFGYFWSLKFGFFVGGLYWLGHAIAVDLATFWWAMPFALFGLPAFLALFYGLVGYLLTWLNRWATYQVFFLVTILCAAWLSADLLRSFLFTGFPWNLLGTVWTVHEAPMQAAAVGGVHLLTFLALMWGFSAAFLFGSGWRQASWAWLLFILVPLGLFAHGFVRINALDTTAGQNVPNLSLRLVQANIAQDLKWDPDRAITHLQKHIDLSVGPGEDGAAQPDLIIWSESAVAFTLNQNQTLREQISQRVLAPGQLLMTGGNRIEDTATGVGGSGSFQVWNHLYILDHQGREISGYDKHHLVPFGEYMPLRTWLPLAKLTAGQVDFTAGPGPSTLYLKTSASHLLDLDIPAFSPLICYEGIFTGQVVSRNQNSERPEWLLSVTNDGWFGLSSGPYQHLSATVLRSVEEGLPLVRVSNPGVSVVTDALGREVASLALGKVGHLDTNLPKALEKPTFYASNGARFPIILIAICFIAANLSAFYRMISKIFQVLMDI